MKNDVQFRIKCKVLLSPRMGTKCGVKPRMSDMKSLNSSENGPFKPTLKGRYEGKWGVKLKLHMVIDKCDETFNRWSAGQEYTSRISHLQNVRILDLHPSLNLTRRLTHVYFSVQIKQMNVIQLIFLICRPEIAYAGIWDHLAIHFLIDKGS